jgi:hypothetical protein
MRRRAIMAFALILVSGIASAAWWLSQEPEPSIKFDNFDRISKGMTEEEVEDLLGGPPGYYTRKFVGAVYAEGPKRVTGLELCQRQGGKEWIANRGSIYVEFDEHGRVCDARQGEAFLIVGDSWYSRLIRWFTP